MNVRMWQHPATQRNLAHTEADGVHVVGPNDGEMACGEFGPGRMAEPAEILAAIEQLLTPGARPLAGRKVVITAGPTREPIDPVRFISNQSSGKQGYAIAEAAVALGAETILVSGPTALADPARRADDAGRDGRTRCSRPARSELPCDIAIFTAAVADWRVASDAGREAEEGGCRAAGDLSWPKTPTFSQPSPQRKTRPTALVRRLCCRDQDVIANAKSKLAKKGCDLIVANDVSAGKGVFGGDRNRFISFPPPGSKAGPSMSKAEVATPADGSACRCHAEGTRDDRRSHPQARPWRGSAASGL